MLTYHDALAISRMADAEVRSVDGVPCFAISKNEEKRNGVPLLGALIISDLSSRPVKKVWSFLLPGDITIPIPSHTCLRYGKAPTGSSSKPPPELHIGRVYDVFLNARPDDPSDPTYGYAAKFCLIAKPDGQREVIFLRPETKAWKDEVCTTDPTPWRD